MFQDPEDLHQDGRTIRLLKRWLAVFAILLVCGFAAFWAMFIDLRREEALLVRQNAALFEEMIVFERATGYGGFIHNFKNAVLRPDEPRYLQRAAADVTRALESLERIEGLILQVGMVLDLSPVRAAIDRYAEMISVLEGTPPLTTTARELDALVRTPDDLAVDVLLALVERARDGIMARHESVENGLARLTAVSLAINTLLLGAGGVVLVLLRRREGDSIRSIELANARLELVLETSTNGVLALDDGRRVLIANHVARDMFGLPEQTPPFAWPSGIALFSAEDLNPLEAAADPIERTLRGETVRGELVALRPVGERQMRYLRISSCQAAPSARATPAQVEIRLVMVFEDVTEQEANRQKFERAGRLDALGQLTGGIAHDFNNILASIMYAIELSLNDPLPEKARNWLTRAKKSVQRGSELARRLLAFARQQPGIALSRPVGELLKETESLVRSTIESAIEIEIDCPDEDLWVHCDQGQLENALLNLILNSRDAIRHSGQGDRIKIAVRGVDRPLLADPGAVETPKDRAGEPGTRTRSGAQQRERFVEISVTDNGPGMSSEVRRRAIDPFFTTKGKNSGSGLGLSIVYGFVQQAGGELRIYSEPKLGTTVRMLIPRGGAGGAADTGHVRLPTPMGHSEKLLIVEDDEGLLRMLEDVVDSLGYRFVTAFSGAEALRLVDEGLEFDLLLTDIVMPGNLDGYGLAREVRDRLPDVPIVYMSGYAGLEGSNVGDVAGPWIQKPCTAAELARVLRSSFNSA